jgi:rod shape-determining protein MreB
MLNYLFGLFSRDLGIDLGTANTLVAVRGQGVVVREPSVVARHKKTKQILTLGRQAKQMVGKTPTTIEAIRPLRAGVISDFDAAEAMISHWIRFVHEPAGVIPKLPRPKVIIGIPSGVTEVERRAVQEAALSAGARQAFLIEEPMAAAIGAGLAIEEPTGILIVDIGGGTTEIAVISLGGIVVNRSIRMAGDEMNEAIISYFRTKHSLLLGEPTAENMKIKIGSASPLHKSQTITIRGRDLETGLPKSLSATSSEVSEALSPVIRQIILAIQDTIEEVPPELISDILERGIVLAGGGALIQGLDKLLSEETKMPVVVADDPLTCVVRGCLSLHDHPQLLHKVRITGGLR